MLIRSNAIPRGVSRFALLDDLATLQRHTDYSDAKAGSHHSAFRLIADLVAPKLKAGVGAFPENAIFASPFASELAGDNALPIVLAMFCAKAFGGACDLEIVQKERVFHTGADPMERLISRPTFDGAVSVGRDYVLVDDVTNMGNTLAELANFIIYGGGNVVGYCVMVDDGRIPTLIPDCKTIRLLEERFGNEIEDIFGISISCLTANEAQYLIGFRSADEIRGRCAKAKEEIHRRRLAKSGH